MNTEKLISKYLDSNLTNEEDAILRFAINNDLKAKKSFEQSVHIFSIMKKDAREIRVPKKLLSNTEDIIMMKYIDSANVNIRAIPVKKNYKYAYNLIAASVCFLFINLFFISDLKYNPKINNSESETTTLYKYNTIDLSDNLSLNQEQVIANEKKTEKKYIQKVNSENILNETARINDLANNDEVLSEINNNTIVGNDLEQEIKYPSTVLNSMEVGKTNTEYTDNQEIVELQFLQPIDEAILLENNLLSKENYKTLNNNNIQNTNLNDIREFKLSTNAINLSSFFGTDIIRSGISDDQNTFITNFSQSVTYSITNSHSVGVEFGYSNYAYNEKFESQGTNNNKIKNSSGTIYEVNDLKTTPLEFNYKSLSFNTNKQIYWGAAYYELLMLDNNIFSLQSRVGAGLTEEGPLSYGRIFSCYRLFKGFNITIGTEGRVFYSRFPEISQTSKELKATFSIIYGFQINL
ncbi:MAG TPA: hypothetical protein PKY56_03670 [Candidatus Kapabacteria bacterium]|nr:hypothetical protein [Candidatus Kapabacteria bacterium]HPO62261.1 hypothetical protein [Candidatus Kapabacteria bacterium]